MASGRHSLQTQRLRWERFVVSHALRLAAVLLAVPALAQGPALPGNEPAAEMTLAQFRALAAARVAAAAPAAGKPRPPRSEAALPDGDALFLQLLLIQARTAAVHQSLDRLAGWSKAIQSRFQIQSAPELDVAVIRYEEARRAAESARLAAEQKRIAGRANRLLGRPPEAPLRAVLPETSAGEPDGVAKQLQEALAQGVELVGKMYSNYQFGGIPLATLLQYENDIYQAEVSYRQWVARRAMEQAGKPSAP
ncbi:MAG TPA: hypothetical protein VNN17_07680 [Terriglobia bacterium]|nr:hypothetical protein [Terriglobia bacterium]